MSDSIALSRSESVFQEFQSKDGEPLQSVPAHSDKRFGDYFVKWSDIQDAFPEVSYLLDNRGDRVLLEVTMADGKYELASPLRLRISRHPFTVVLWTPPKDATDVLYIVDDFVTFSRWSENITSSRLDIATSPQFNPNLEFYKAALVTRYQQGEMRSVVEYDKLGTPHDVLAETAPRLFLVLPSDLDVWDDSDPSTHTFRLYYLCDFDYEYPRSELHPQHIHISDHRGYDLDRPQEFIQRFGRFALTMLEIIRDGLNDGGCFVPKLESLEILNGCADSVSEHGLDQNTLAPLVNKAIEYLREFFGDDQMRPVWVNSRESRLVQSFLYLQEDDNSMGNLFRFLGPSTVRWLCMYHAVEPDRLLALLVVVGSLNGEINTQRGTIDVAIPSPSQLETFGTVLRYSKHDFDVSVRLLWNPSMQDLQDLLQQCFGTGCRRFQIEGVTLEVLHQHPQEYNRDLFVWRMGVSIELLGQLVTLLNYPRLAEKYIYFSVDNSRVIGLAFADEGYELDVDWPDMRVKLKAFVDSPWVADSLDPVLDRKWARLSNIVNPLLGQGLKGIDIFDERLKTLQCRLGVENGAISGIEELHLPFCLFQFWTAKYPALKRLVIRPGQPRSTEILFQLIADNPGLCLADVPIQEHSLLSTIRTFCYMWLLCPRSFTFTFFEQDMNHDGRVVAKMEIKPVPKNHGDGMEINMVEWMYSHVATAVDDLGTMILESATRYSPTALASLRLDVSQLKDHGLAGMKKVLKQSNLEQLFVECETFDLSRSSLVGQVLGAVSWSNIVSLEISGSCINDFLQVWMLYGNPFEPFDPSSVESAFSGSELALVKALFVQNERLETLLRIYAEDRSPSSELATFGLRLKSLTVRSTGHTHQPLSHASVLFIHNLIYSSSLVDLSLENVQLQDNQDWDLVIDAIDFSQLVVLGMFKSNFQDVQMLLEKLGEQRTPLEVLDLRYTPADEELRKKFRYN